MRYSTDAVKMYVADDCCRPDLACHGSCHNRPTVTSPDFIVVCENFGTPNFVTAHGGRALGHGHVRLPRHGANPGPPPTGPMDACKYALILHVWDRTDVNSGGGRA
jgi:hypothetical protein